MLSGTTSGMLVSKRLSWEIGIDTLALSVKSKTVAASYFMLTSRTYGFCARSAFAVISISISAEVSGAIFSM